MKQATYPTVAVVITFYCDDETLTEALDSVLNQTRPPDEVVVVDDASPGVREVLEKLTSPVRVVRHHENLGPGAARQTGVESTTSDWIAFLDADDIWMPSKLECQLAELAERRELSAHHTGLVTFFSDGREVERLDKPSALDLTTQLKRNQVMPSALLIRREALSSVRGWSSNRRIMEDWDLMIRFLDSDHKIGYLNKPLVRFRRMDQGNLSSRGFRHMFANLATIRRHRRLYRTHLRTMGTLSVAGRVIYDEGCRRGGPDGFFLRGVSRLVALGGPVD